MHVGIAGQGAGERPRPSSFPPFFFVEPQRPTGSKILPASRRVRSGPSSLCSNHAGAAFLSGALYFYPTEFLTSTTIYFLRFKTKTKVLVFKS